MNWILVAATLVVATENIPDTYTSNKAMNQCIFETGRSMHADDWIWACMKAKQFQFMCSITDDDNSNMYDTGCWSEKKKK